MTSHNEKIWVMDESDANFDGYPDLWAMTKFQRERYLKRAERSYYALQEFNFQKMKKIALEYSKEINVKTES